MAAPCGGKDEIIEGDVFRKMDAISWQKLVYKKVRVQAAHKYSYTGWIYTIDPVSKSILLADFDTKSSDGQIPLTVVLGQEISHVHILEEDIDKHKISLDQLFHCQSHEPSLSKEEISAKKQKLKEWLELHRVPVTESGKDGELLNVSQVLTIEPPYSAENCVCTNEIILARVQALVRNMLDTT
ncbi:gem-associated protein 6-like [Diadema antillarum]|uniref:gem-associated protein 6-like n=1 Tax=Diadema antillarum TaxID=105358 RepID=UPI003A8673EF